MGIQTSVKILAILACVLIIVLGLIFSALFLFLMPVAIVMVIYAIYYWGKRLDENLSRIQNRLDRIVELLDQQE